MQIKRIKTCVIIVFLLWIMVYGLWTSNAAVPHLINYQARLVDKDGRALDGRYKVTLGIYDAAAGGAGLWEETRESIDIEEGMLSVMLGDVTALNLTFDKDYYLQIKVGDEVLGPRQRITSAGYAIKAEVSEVAQQSGNADTVDGFHASSTASSNKVLVADSNAKLPVSALKIYDSGWFAVSDNQTYTKTHSLGTTKLLITAYLALDSSGSRMKMLDYYDGNGQSSSEGSIENITSTQYTFKAYHFTATVGCQGGEPNCYAAQYARVIMLALE